jgi:hypothetical protein
LSFFAYLMFEHCVFVGGNSSEPCSASKRNNIYSKYTVNSMNVFDALMGRRSIRKYTDKKIPEEKITTLLKAAMNAPSGGERPALVLYSCEQTRDVVENHEDPSLLEDA